MKEKDNKIIENFESLISNGHTEFALESLLEYVQKNNLNVKKSLILVSSQFSRIKKNNKSGRYTLDDLENQYLKIDRRILDFLDLIRDENRKVVIDQESSKYLSITIELPELIRTPLQQYFIFFSDYIKSAKGVDLIFEVLKNEVGLEISINNKNDIPLLKIQEWLNEYINFTKTNFENLKINIEIENLSENDYEVLIDNLKNQISHLKNSIEILRKNGNHLIDEKKYLKNIDESKGLIHIGSDISSISPLEKAKELIAEGKSQKSLEVLISFVKEEERQDELRILFSRINNLNLDFRLGTINEDYRYKELNKINKAILDLIQILTKKNKV